MSVRAEYVQTSEAVSEPVPPPLVRPEMCLPTEPAVVSVDVATFQMSVTNVPNVVRDRVPLAHTAVGIVATRDDEAVKTAELVLLLIVVMADEI